MRTLRYLIEKEFKQIRRDRFLPRIIFMIPLLQLLILPFAANFEMRNINLGVIDLDHSVYSQRLIDKVLSSGYFRLTDVSSSYEEGLSAIEDDRADILLEIPADFEKNLSTLSISANAINGTKGGLGSAYLSSIIQSFNTEIGNIMSVPTGPTITSTYLYNPHLNYKNYMVPGIIVFLLSIIGGALSALNIVSEKEKGTIEQINVTPVPKVVFLLSKLIPFWVIGLVLLTLGSLIAWLVYGLAPVGSFATIYLFAAIYLIAFTGLGLTISAVSSTQSQAMFTAFFFLIIFALMSGLFTPINSMPEWAQKVTLFNPIRYFIDVMRMVYLKGSHFADLTHYFFIVCLFAIGFNALAIIAYRKR
ncbi:ABC transporter permease [Bacteroidia bacterium]|nr:ABC transporter permease [Bacteroidia bacterium]